jgi:hypothetical protein
MEWRYRPLHMQHGLGRRPLATVLDARGIQLSRLHALTEWSGQPTRGAFGWVVRALGRGARYTSGARSPNKAQAAEGPCRLWGKGGAHRPPRTAQRLACKPREIYPRGAVPGSPTVRASAPTAQGSSGKTGQVAAGSDF